MPNPREIVKRRSSVSSIHKITRTMEMVSTSKFRKTYRRALGARPYTDTLADLVTSLATGKDAPKHPLLQANHKSKRTAILVLTTNRGLCGGYNGAVLELALEAIERLLTNKQELELRVSGKKGGQYFRFIGQTIDRAYTAFDDKTGYQDILPLADELIEDYTTGKIRAVQVVYTRLQSKSRFTPELLTLLPFTEMVRPKTVARRKISFDEYVFSPGPKSILDELIPATIRAILFNCFIDTVVSEQIARMNAMQAATSNAEQMIEALARQYNRVRQSIITSELLDIIGGTEALR